MRNWKLIVLIVLLLVSIGAVLVALHYKSESEKKLTLPENVKKQVQAEASIIARKVDKDGLEHVTIKETENIIPFNKKDRIAISQGVMDTTAQALARVGILEKQLQSLMIVNSTLVAENLRAKQVVNTAGRLAYQYKDKYVDLTYTPPVATDTLDKGAFAFSYNADLNIVQYWKRKWFLASKNSYIDIYSNDTRTTINGVKRLVVEQKQPAFGLRLQANSSYNVGTGEFSYGPAARVDIGRFSIQGRYSKFPNNSKWVPSVNASYDLIRF